MEKTPGEKIKSLSRILAIFAKALLIAAIIAYAALSIFLFSNFHPSGHMHGYMTFEGIKIQLENLTVISKALIFIVTSVFLVLFLKLLLHFEKLFREFAKGNLFTDVTIGQIKRIGITVFCLAIAKVAAIPIAAYLLQFAPDSSYKASLPIDAFIIGIIVFLISWIMSEGKKLKDDSDLVI